MPLPLTAWCLPAPKWNKGRLLEQAAFSFSNFLFICSISKKLAYSESCNTFSNSSSIDHGRDVIPAIIAGDRPFSVRCDQQKL